MQFHNPIHRHYMITVVAGLALAVLVISLSDPAELMIAIVCVSVAGLAAVLFSGKCQHCGFAIPHARFSAQVWDIPEACVNCGKSYSEPVPDGMNDNDGR